MGQRCAYNPVGFDTARFARNRLVGLTLSNWTGYDQIKGFMLNVSKLTPGSLGSS